MSDKSPQAAENLGEQTDSGAILLPHVPSKRTCRDGGVARENVSRILSDFEQKRLVTKSGGSFQIEDKAKLEGEIDW